MSARPRYFVDAGAPSSPPAAGGVYLDHNATTPLDPRVRAAMIGWLELGFGNPSSIHGFGQRARGVLEDARERVAALLGAAPVEVVFTASGTEANNAVLATFGRRAPGGHLVTTALEHPSVTRAAARLTVDCGFQVTEVAPDPRGVVSVEAVAAALRRDTALVAVMLANNELGTIQPVAGVAAVCRERGIPVLCDAVQAAGKIPVRVAELDVDYLTVGAHKLHGPLGAAALWVRPGAPLDPLLVGGSQERRRRASTENLLALLGFGLACELAGTELESRARHLSALRDELERGLAGIPAVTVRGAGAARLPNTTSATFHGLDASTLLMRLDLAGFAVSTGAACASGTVEPSRTLLSLGLARADALATLRVSFGITNTRQEVAAFLPVLAAAAVALRANAAGAGR
ncbi:MAG TPA: cysteine desulfurase family protein [Thermoanaerobaculia bacterium]|nr:cysteine desulfurase family protein [Thermoanaerobaculia bacterium]